MEPTLKEFLLSAIRPSIILVMATYQLILAIVDVLLECKPGVLFHASQLQERAFSRFWNAYGEIMSEEMPMPMMALLKTVKGTVLDIGPGTGDQLRHFDASKIVKAYGAEPTLKLHDKLKINATKAGLGDKYSALHCGGEPESLFPALAKAGLLEGGAEGVFDEVVCVRVLCGVPRPEETVKGLYKLLKPGGRLVLHEHIVNPWKESGGSFISRCLQAIYMALGWKFLMGSCCMDRDTKSIALAAGGKDGWSQVQLQYLNPWSPFPYLVGSLVKKD
ncbi:uncharacterized protein K452DRAFT_351445 [Aplosporella prunicola CBS 121167]|uniref:Methyltransferase type 11 domain-containing protein n=1 Tax=Aplosporella prunicola CBS 121167 TaxID=1176127 RepID=A0A6A6BB37_9PEZI|nr:uncharacterized protein K452DRAFT_351445 [Aplosporella prunicola CBS 121167]KAF2141310.1 hypothetical protein K452DRAFT_351445 [Aplosporella prunicola CBS 121167]